MRHLITNVDTFLKDRQLFVKIKVDNEWEPFGEPSFDSIVRNVGQISILELDILEGCYLEPSTFYKRGEKMPDERVAYAENRFPKNWKITFDGTLDDLRKRNHSMLLEFQSIYSITISAKNSKEPYVIVRTTNNNTYKSKLHIFKSLVGINENEFSLLIGAFIAPIMYKKGDISEYNGRFIKITQDNKIVATFNIRIEGTIDHNFNLYGDQILKKNINSGNQRYEGDYDENYQRSYEKYNGYNDFDDDTIDTAFEGDPEATWNID